jgi:opacity protein-like surface antigen
MIFSSSNSTKASVAAAFMVFATAFNTYSQDADAGAGKKLSYGGRIGMNLSSFNKEQFNVGPKFGFSIGGYVNYKIIDMVSAQVELLYMQQGGKEFTQESSSSVSGIIVSETTINRITLHNLEIPLLAKVNIPGLGGTFGMKPYGLIGPSLGMNLGATNRSTTHFDFKSGRSVVITDRDNETPSNYQTAQWGFNFGAGAEMKLKSLTLNIDVRYRRGLNTIATNYDIDSFVKGYGDGKSNTLSLNLGVGF